MTAVQDRATPVKRANAFGALLRDGAVRPRAYQHARDGILGSRSVIDDDAHEAATAGYEPRQWDWQADTDDEQRRHRDAPAIDRGTAPPAAGGSSWTAGRSLAGRVATLALWVAITCGPIALVANVLVPPPEASSAPSTEGAESTDALGAGALAVSFVGAWLSATATNPEPFATMLPGAVVEAANPTAYRDLTVAAIAGPDASGLIAVTVAGLVDESVPVDTSSPAVGAGSAAAHVVWMPRAFQVTVATEGGLSAIAEPAAVAPPAGAEPVDAPEQPLEPASEAGTAVALFLSAYLTSSPDLERFTSPDAQIDGLLGAPYVSVSVRDLRVLEQPTSPPVAGQRIDVRASVSAVTPAEESRVLTYWLTLSARDGRWEVAAISVGPATPNDDDAN